MTGGPLVIVGDALLDRDVDGRAERLCPDAPVPVLEDACDRLRPGGAALAALLAAAGSREVTLIAPLGDDRASVTVRSLLPAAVTVVPLPLRGPLQEKTRFRTSGQTMLRVDRPRPAPGPAGPAAVAALRAAGALLVCDYGHGTTADPLLREALGERAGRVPLVWDPHPRGTGPVPGTRLATPNAREAAGAAGLGRPPEPGGVRAACEAAQRLLGVWPADSVAVTLGGEGALLARRGALPVAVPASPLAAADTCGAGDQFAAAAAIALSEGAVVPEAVTAAVAAATRFLAGGGVAGLPLVAGRVPRPRTGTGVAGPAAPAGGAAGVTGSPAGPGVDAVRARGGTVVAAGGCFDLLHAGHVSMLRAARGLGDCLVVCLNSDASVRRLKGPGRPLNPAADRAAVLAALDCVDQVLIFEEDTPERLLGQFRPDIWVKGGDYDGRELPEAEALRQWDGRVVTVPYLTGRSTSRLASAAALASGPAGQP